MIFRKPINTTYIDMAIYIDKTAYTKDHDAQKIYEYLYHIVKHLSLRYRFFKYSYHYDDFAIFSATRIYMRLINKKQFDVNSERKLAPIKSILNYINKILYPLKVDYEQSNYYQSILKDESIDYYNYTFNTLVNTYIDEIQKIDFYLTLESISNICKYELENSLYIFNKIQRMNILLSVQLSLLNQITLTKQELNYINHLLSTNRLKDLHVIDIFKSKSNDVILFHIDKSMKDFIIVLVKKVKNYIFEELSEFFSLDNSYLNTMIYDNYKDSIEGNLFDEKYI